MSQVQLQPMPQMQPFIHNPCYSQVPTTTMSQVPPMPPALSSQQTYPFQQQTYQPAHFPYPGHEQCNVQRCYQEMPEPNVHQLPSPPTPPPPPPHSINPELSGMARMPRYEEPNIHSREVLPSQNAHLAHTPKASLPDTMNVPGMYPVASASGSAIESRNGNGSASGSTSIPHRNGISNGLIQYQVPIPAQAPNSNAEQAPWQRFTTAGDCTRSETGRCDDDDDGQGKGDPTSFGKGGTSVSAPASGRLNGWHGQNEKKANGNGNGQQAENKPECQ